MSASFAALGLVPALTGLGRNASSVLAIALSAIGAVAGEVALVSAHAARGAAVQYFRLNEQGFIQFALARARPRPGAAARLTIRQKNAVAGILRDSRKAAHDARRLAQQDERTHKTKG
jgi:hypothetical protein